LLEMRKARKITQTDFSKNIEIPQANISFYEKGRSVPNDNIVNFCRALRLPLIICLE